VRHALIVALFVGLWMALGALLRLDANAYLLLGIPLTAAFQVFVCRRPLRAMWVHGAPAFRPTRAWLIATAALAALPIYELATLGIAHGVAIALWYVAAIAGAPAAAYALVNLDRRALRALALVLVMVIAVGLAMVALAVQHRGADVLNATSLMQIAVWSLLYFAVLFVIEEVVFRGALDTFMRVSSFPGWLSAAFVALLWGLWHLPIVPWPNGLAATAVQLAVFHLIVGVVLAYAWRIGGNLAIPAAAHALLDGLRNGLMLFGT
jgi:membrane protease YdiL (CAAX protease family)